MKLYLMPILFIFLFSRFAFAVDVEAPTLTSFSITPSQVDLTTGAGFVDFSITAEDSGSGVDYVQVGVQFPGITSCPNAITVLSNDSGVWKARYGLTTEDKGGVYEICRVIVRDSAGQTPNSRTYSQSELVSLGFASQFDVVNPDADTVAPTLTSFSITPSQVDLTTGAGFVDFSITAEDSGSGVDYVQVGVQFPGITSCPNAITVLSNDSGVWKARYDLTTEDKGGVYEICRVIVRDSAGQTPNSRTYSQSELVSLGFSYQFKVVQDTDGDGVDDASDAFPLDPTESVDTDGDGIGNNGDTDDDGDGLPDAFEIDNGLDPLDSADASLDADNDGMSNLEEYQQGTDLFNPPADATAPVVNAPTDVRVSSSGDFTEVELGEATANDNVDGVLAPVNDRSGPFEPGRHIITWSAIDAAGNTGSDTQIVDVLPLAGFEVDQFADEGSSISVKVILNGDAPEYPVTIPIELAGTAVQGDDFMISSNEISIAEGRVGSVVVTIVSDSLEETEETITLSLGVLNNAAAGDKSTHHIVITVPNQAPVASLNLSQDGSGVSAVTINGGLALLSSEIRDPNSDDTHTFDWSASENAVAPLSGEKPDEFRFDPSGLQEGVYVIRLTVADDGTPKESSSYEFPITVITGDSLGPDANGNGLPDSLDVSSDTSTMFTSENGKLMTEAGLRLRIGSVATASMNLSPIINESLLAEHGSRTGGPGLNIEDDYQIVGGLFDFEIHDLRAAGQSVLLVLPLSEAIPAKGVYRKYVPDVGWQMFIQDSNNQIYSANSGGTACPAVGSDSYSAGIVEGNDCLQLRIQDGGPNDTDSSANGVIKDPGGVAMALSADEPDDGGTDGGSSSSGGGGCAINPGAKPDPMLPLMVLISLIYLMTRRRRLCSKV